MTTIPQIKLPSLKKTKLVADFSAGHVSSDGGAVLLRQADRFLGLTKAAAGGIQDSRQSGKVTHKLIDTLRQRIYGIALGYEDLNDHDYLRKDPAFQTAVGSTSVLASTPTLCRLEASASRDTAKALSGALLQAFFAKNPRPPKELILDFDPTDFRIHGEQEGKHFHAYYGDHCYLPLYVFAGSDLLVAYLRPSSKDPALHVGAVLRVLVSAIRARWPKVKIIFRGDSGMCRHHILGWCDRNDVGYVVGLAKNSKLEELASKTIRKAERKYKKKGSKVRLFCSFKYRAGSWFRKRRVVARIDHCADGKNPRYVVTNLTEGKRTIYEDLYCLRGDAENRIKEQKLSLFADRVSSHTWWSNQLRVLMSAMAYTLINAIRSIGLRGTEFASSMADTIRLRLLKIGCLLERRAGRIRLRLSSAFSKADEFRLALARLSEN